MNNVVGQSIAHESAHLHVSGEALYSSEIAKRFNNVLVAYPVMSPHAHAKILSIDSSAAYALPGVVKVLTAEDVPGVNDTGTARQDEPLFPSEVMYHSQAVAWVLAESEEQARLGAAAVKIDYQALPALVHLEDAIAAESFHSAPFKLARGDAESHLQEAEHVLEGELFVGGQEHFYLETQGSFAYLDEMGQVMVYASTQHPTETQHIVSHVLHVDQSQVTVQCLRMGGGFGGKESQANPYASVAALGAVLTGRPTVVSLHRIQDMVLTGKRHPFLGKFKAGYDDSGKLHALQLSLYCDGGWSLDLSEPVLGRAMFHADNSYLLSHVDIQGWICKTHKTSQTAYRGFGGPQGMIMIEEIMTRIAHTLNVSPEQVRERNFYNEGDTTHYSQPVKDAMRIKRVWHEVQRKSSYSERQKSVAQFNAQNPHRKRGIAITPVKFGISFTATWYNQAGALVLIHQDGSVQITHGGTEMGQGLHSKMMQIAAQTLGVGLGNIRLMTTRTDKVPNTSATAASSGSDLNGAAVKDACEKLKERLSRVAGAQFAIHPNEVVFEQGNVYPLGRPEQAVSFASVVKAAYMQRVQLFSDGFYRTPNLHYDRSTMQGKPFHYFSYGAAVCEVEVDTFTGEYEFKGVDIVHDVGDSISPRIDIGQVEGAYVQGVGWLTREELVWHNDGRLLTKGPSTYKIPSFCDIPEHFNVHLLERAKEEGVVYGSKAVGEPPFMLAFAAREALKAAIHAHSGKLVKLASPATPEAVYWALQE